MYKRLLYGNGHYVFLWSSRIIWTKQCLCFARMYRQALRNEQPCILHLEGFGTSPKFSPIRRSYATLPSLADFIEKMIRIKAGRWSVWSRWCVNRRQSFSFLSVIYKLWSPNAGKTWRLDMALEWSRKRMMLMPPLTWRVIKPPYFRSQCICIKVNYSLVRIWWNVSSCTDIS